MAKILLVEDDPLMIRMYQRKLSSDGYNVDLAVNGEEGLVKIRSFRPDLVLLDIMMPKLNGLQVLERVKSDPTIAAIPVVILTNLGGSQEDIERGLELGAVAYLVKSAYRPDQVLAKVKEVLAGYTRSKEIPQAAEGGAAQKIKEATSTLKPIMESSQPKIPTSSKSSQNDIASSIRDLLQKQFPSAEAPVAPQSAQSDSSQLGEAGLLVKLKELLAGQTSQPSVKSTEGDIVTKLKELL